ncbi:hypothetical protein ACTOJ1_000514 [Shigella flexneri]
MKKYKVYKLQTYFNDYSCFLEKNYKHYSNSIKHKALYEQNWKPFDLNNFKVPEFELLPSDNNKRNYQFDISSPSSPFYIFSEKAVEALKDILEPRGQFLPIITPSKRKKYIGYYPTNPLINMIDVKKSGMEKEDLETFGVRNINDLYLKQEAELDDYIICFSEERLCVLVTEKFRKRVEEAGLEGFDFIYSNYEITLL